MEKANPINLIKLATDKLKEWSIYAFLFTVPIFYIPWITDLRMVQEKYFQASAMVLSSLFFGNIWLSLFFCLNMALFVIYGAEVGASQVTNVFMTGLTFACARNFFKDRPFSPFIKPLIIITVLSLFYTVTQLLRIEIIGVPVSAAGVPMAGGNVQPNGLFYLPAFHAIFLSMMIPAITFLVSGWKRWIGLLLIVPIFIMRCSGAYLAVAFIIPFIIYHTKRKLFIPCLILMTIVGGAFTFIDHKIDPLTYKSRLVSWHMMLRYTMLNPLGWGPDSFRNYNKYKNFLFKSDEDYNPMIMKKVDKDTEVLSYYSIDQLQLPENLKGRIPKGINTWQEAHSEFIQSPFEYGILGVLLIFLFLKEAYDRFMVSDKKREVLAIFGMLLVLLISSVTQFPFHVARTAGILGVLLGSFWAMTDKSYNLAKGDE